MKSNRCVNTAATLQAVYLVWLFLRITTMCNLSVFAFVRRKFPESFAHAQTVDTRPLFPLTMWPGYEAIPVPASLLVGSLPLQTIVNAWLHFHLIFKACTKRDIVNS